MTDACDIFARHCVAGIEADDERCRQNVHNSTALLTALVDASATSGRADRPREAAGPCGQIDIRQLVIERGLLTAEEFDALTSPRKRDETGIG